MAVVVLRPVRPIDGAGALTAERALLAGKYVAIEARGMLTMARVGIVLWDDVAIKTVIVTAMAVAGAIACDHVAVETPAIFGIAVVGITGGPAVTIETLLVAAMAIARAIACDHVMVETSVIFGIAVVGITGGPAVTIETLLVAAMGIAGIITWDDPAEIVTFRSTAVARVIIRNQVSIESTMARSVILGVMLFD